MAKTATTKSASKGKANLSFAGWRRENGRVGVRNHVLILPLDDLSNAACEAVANNSKARWRSRMPTAACSSVPTWICISAP
jgi:altronate dehydratase